MNKLKVLAVTAKGIGTRAVYGDDDDVKKFLVNSGFNDPGKIGVMESGLSATPADKNEFFVYKGETDGIDKGLFRLTRRNGDRETVIDEGFVDGETYDLGEECSFDASGKNLPKWRFFCDPKSLKSKKPVLSPFQRVAAHPKGALAILRFLRGSIANKEKEMEGAMRDVSDIYDEIFSEPAMMPRFMGEMLANL